MQIIFGLHNNTTITREAFEPTNLIRAWFSYAVICGDMNNAINLVKSRSIGWTGHLARI